MKKINILGMKLDEWRHKSCLAHFCDNGDWVSLYDIQSLEKNKGHAQELLIKAKKYYERDGVIFGGTVALNPVMKHIYKKLKITEYE